MHLSTCMTLIIIWCWNGSWKNPWKHVIMTWPVQRACFSLGFFFACLGNECFAFHNIKICTPSWFILHAIIYFTSLSNIAFIFQFCEVLFLNGIYQQCISQLAYNKLKQKRNPFWRNIISPSDILIDEILVILNTSLSKGVAWDEITFWFTNHDRSIESQHWKGPWVIWFISVSKERSNYT